MPVRRETVALDDPLHEPVLYKEIIHALRPGDGGFYVDCTTGAGGHAFGILEASSPGGRLLGLDLDPAALEIARRRLAPFGDRVVLRRRSYTGLAAELNNLGWGPVDGIVLDLGVSSMQLDRGERGFSFNKEAPLDMRFDPTQPTTAADLVNELPERDLADLLYRYGEERRSRQIARAIVNSRPLRTTLELAAVIARTTGGGKIHPATRSFQALRIATNRELENLETVLPQAVAALRPGGRLAVIAFHSLEDRIVKGFFRQESRDCICPPEQPVCTCGHTASIVEIARKPLRPGDEEILSNPRARSARLRIAERIET
jgi:16S rRNA (cytosine1402-N4)-methyltransferase